MFDLIKYLYCVGWGVKLYSLTHSLFAVFEAAILVKCT